MIHNFGEKGLKDRLTHEEHCNN